MKDLDVNMAIRNIFLNATLRATVHLGKDYTEFHVSNGKRLSRLSMEEELGITSG